MKEELEVEYKSQFTSNLEEVIRSVQLGQQQQQQRKKSTSSSATTAAAANNKSSSSSKVGVIFMYRGQVICWVKASVRVLFCNLHSRGESGRKVREYKFQNKAPAL